MWRWMHNLWKSMSRWWLGALAVLAIVALRSWSGHEGTAPQGLPALDRPARDAPWKQALWGQVLVADNALLHRQEYLLADPDFLDPLDLKLDNLYYRHRHPPQTQAERDEYLAILRSAYLEALHSPDGLQRLEKRVADVFAAPQVTQDQATGTVTADFGVVPGTVANGPTNGYVITKSPHLGENRLPKSDLVAGRLKDLAREHPASSEIVVRLCPLHDEQARFCEYHYRRERGNNGTVTGLLTVSPPTDKRSPFYREWTHVVHDDGFDRWILTGYDLHQSLREQTASPLVGAMLEMDVSLVLAIHASDATGTPVWRPDSSEIAIRTVRNKWISTPLQHVPRLFPQQWEGQKMAAWPPGEVDSSGMADRAGQWETAAAPGSRGEAAVSDASGIRYEVRQLAGRSELIRTTPNADPVSLLKVADDCRDLALSPDREWLAVRAPKLGVLLLRVGQDRPVER